MHSYRTINSARYTTSSIITFQNSLKTNFKIFSPSDLTQKTIIPGKLHLISMPKIFVVPKNLSQVYVDIFEGNVCKTVKAWSKTSSRSNQIL